VKVVDGLTAEQRAQLQKLEATAREIAWYLDKKLNPDMTTPADREHRNTGFGLLVFPLGDKGAATWISNSDRGDMIKAVEEWLAHAKGRS
jgi:hypothetical protein